MKMHHHLMTSGINVAKNKKFICDTIGHTARCTYSTLRQSHSAALRPNGGNFDLKKSSVIWLGMHAFHHVLSKRPGVYGTLLESLRFQLALFRKKPLKHRLRSVVKDGLAGVATVHF
ncbi:hypothetical protein DFJ58DRAFT_648427 [Suillus subalutaceus]|uniref:uncharacterized protein n=1 Tax=Suillus subalutaceus TaxID=48586 RepID=UPI001B85CCC0|nr:uncharacterized protein DFJ58DRAFT_648427 [Suillus subalutaceus]KAG1877990.1 hypothetical protein DFJ58DRAFT_648427 [Suillus subalutaceus]